MRNYAPSLVRQIREKEYTIQEKGMEILIKPVPDAQRENALDPRLKAIIEKKKQMFAGRAKEGWKLSNERYRPDKVTMDLTETPVICQEQLIPLGDHMIDGYFFRPESIQGPLPVLVYFHGGGFTAGDIRLFANQMKLIAEKAQAMVVFPEYRLAPENPYPAPVVDAWGTVCWVHQNAAQLGVDPSRLMVAGDSAGGNLVAACLQQDTQGIIKKCMGIYPAWDTSDYRLQSLYQWTYDEYSIVEDERTLMESRIERIKSNCEDKNTGASNLYLQGKTAPTDPMVSVVFAEDAVLARFPETVVVAAEYDYLRVGSDYLARRLHSLGVPVRSIRYRGCDHGFLDLLGTIVQAEELCLTIADEIKKM